MNEREKCPKYNIGANWKSWYKETHINHKFLKKSRLPKREIKCRNEGDRNGSINRTLPSRKYVKV
jgi:hypothetical protein